MTPYYDDGKGIVIFNADCRDVLPTLAVGSLDLCLADPPYGVGKAEWDSEFPIAWMLEAGRIAPVVAVTPGTLNLVRCPERIGTLEYRWTLAIHLVNGMTRGVMGFGNWFPCVVYTQPGYRIYTEQSDIKDIVVGLHPKPDHPSPKPLEAMVWLLGRLPGNCVLDPFLGSGTTALAAKMLGRNCIGVEVEEKYCELAAKRLQQAVLPLDFSPAPIARQPALLEAE